MLDVTEVATTEGLWAPERRRLTTGLVLTITLVAFETLAIATVMPVVADDLGGLGLYGWVFSGFFLGTLLGIVVAGQLADERGTALPYAAGLALFAVGLVVGGLAPTMPVLVAGRVLQGIGAGAIPAVAYATVGRAYPPDLRPRVFAVFSTAWVVPGLIGPAASTGIAEAVGWRAVFLALLPFVAAAAALTLPVLTRPSLGAGAGGDPAGEPSPCTGDAGREGGAVPPRPSFSGERLRHGVALMLGTAAVLAAAGGVPLALAVPLAAVGAPVAARHFFALVPPGTARLVRGIPAAVAVRGLLTFAFFGTDAYVSLTVQEVRDRPTWVAGVALTACTLAWTGGAWAQQRFIGSVGPRRLVATGFLLVAAGIAGMLVSMGDVPIAVAVVAWGVGGAGIGTAYAPLAVTVLGLAEPGAEGSASASIQLSDVLGTSLGTGCGGALVALAEDQGWLLRSGLGIAFGICLVVALLGALAARRLPTALPA